MSEELVRASDADRDRAVASLREFTQRMEAAYGAATAADLAALQDDLPASRPVSAPRRSAPRFLVAIFGDARRSGSLRVRHNPVCAALFGSVNLDLRGALIDDDEVRVQAISIFGSVNVIVPEGVEVDLTGLALFGSKRTQGEPGTLRPGAPLVRVNAFVLFGDANVRVRASR